MVYAGGMKILLIRHCPSSTLVQLGKKSILDISSAKKRSKGKADSLNIRQGGILDLGSVALMDFKQPLSK